MGDRIVHAVVDGYFTKTSLVAHAIVYPILMGLEGGDFHLFLDAISIEAVFIGLLVGVSTKRNRSQQHHLAHLLDRLHRKDQP